VEAKLITLWMVNYERYRERGGISDGDIGPHKTREAARSEIRGRRDLAGEPSFRTVFALDLGEDEVILLKPISQSMHLNMTRDQAQNVIDSMIGINHLLICLGDDKGIWVKRDQENREVTIWNGIGEVKIEDLEALIVRIGNEFYKLDREMVSIKT